MFLECKQCGGQVPVQEGKGVAACPYCGSANTVGKSASSQGGLVNRANYLRRNNEFDKAAGVYEELLKSDNTDYEAHWGLVLCKFGIEYVDDPVSGERKPTCHRTYPDSVFADAAYRAALEYAPLDVREVYEKEAAQIDRIQKDIIALSRREEKFDVFLCYKELDESGNRTQDSVIAQELEFELTRRGYKVFFARKTLEKVLGSAYEPVIYAALQSARAMVVLGTKPEHFQAVWVRNEWSRYRELIKKGADKVLIPAYRGMSPYDLPMELSNLQSLDMGKLGFVQDLCDGIDRFVRADRRVAEPAAAAVPGAPSTETLLKRAFLFIEEGNTDRANEYLERVLDQDPEEPRAYFGKLLIELNLRTESQLRQLHTPLDEYGNFQKAVRFASGELKSRYMAINQAIRDEMEETKRIETEKEERRRAQAAAEEAALNEKRKKEKAAAARERAQRRKKAARFHAVFWPSLLATAALMTLFVLVTYYQKGVSLMEAGKYSEAVEQFEHVKWYDPANEKMIEAIRLEQQERYDKGEAALENGNFDEAIELFSGLGEFSGASDRLAETYYRQALLLYQSGDTKSALLGFIHAGGYRDTDTYLGVLAAAFQQAGEYGNALLAWQGGGRNVPADPEANLHMAAFQDRLRCSLIVGRHTLVLLNDGTVAAAGENSSGECNVSEWRDVAAIAAGSNFSVGLLSNGTVIGTGGNEYGQLDVSKWRGITQIVCGYNCTIGLKSDGTVIGTGANENGQLDVSGWQNITQIAYGGGCTLGLKSDGTLVTAGNTETEQSDVSLWKNVVQIYAGSNLTLGLCGDGTVLAAGDNDFGQCEVSGWTNIAQITAAYSSSAGLRADGTVVTTDQSCDQCQAWSDIVQIASGNLYLVGLRRDGTVELDGTAYWGQREALNWSDIVALYAGDSYLIGIKSDGSIVSIFEKNDKGFDEYAIPDVKLW